MTEAHVVAALVNSTWQSALVALVAFVALHFFKRASAAVRCTVWYGVLAIVAVLPLVDLTTSLVAPAAASPITLRKIVHPSTARVPMSLAELASAQVDAAPSPTEEVAVALGSLASWIERGWLIVALALAARLLYETARLVAAKRRVAPLRRAIAAESPGGRAYRIGVSSDVDTPCVLGLFDPIVVLPTSLAETLSDDDLARVVLHEAAHVQRRDDWIHLFERALRAALFFNPFVYAIGQGLSVEREIACDDLAVARCGNRLAYASCLSSVAAYLSSARSAPAPALFGGRRELVVRVERLLEDAHDGSTRTGRRPFLALAAVATAAFVVAHYGIPVRAQIAKVPVPVVAPAPLVWHPATAARPAQPMAHVAWVPRLRAPSAASPRRIPATAAVAPLPASGAVKARKPHPLPHGLLRRTVGELVILRRHDVDAKFAADVEAALETDVNTTELVALREHDVTPAYLVRMRVAGVRSKCDRDFIRLHEHGVTPHVVAILQRRLGTMRVTVEQLVRLADAGS